MDIFADVVQKGRHAASTSPSSFTLRTRLAFLHRLGQALVASREEWIHFLVTTQHKTPSDALRADILPVLDAIAYLRRFAPRALKPTRVGNGFYLGAWEKAFIHYAPYGVVAIAAPWNFPLQLSLVPALFAFVAGNAVILKPSERVNGLGDLLRKLLAQAHVPPDLFQVIDGDAAVFQKIIAQKPDFVLVTGGKTGGQDIYAQCATRLIPCVLELGGHNTLLVCADAPVRRAAEAAVWGAFMNCGQVCLSVQAVYVHRTVLHAFCTHLETLIAQYTSDIGGMANETSWQHAYALVCDACNKGATILYGRLPTAEDYPSFPPLVLTGVTPSMRLFHEEVFGPVCYLIAYDEPDERALLAQLQRRSDALGVNIFTKNPRRARQWAALLRTGSVSINHVFGVVLRMDVPFGGVGNSGFGRYRGIEGIRTFVTSKAVTVRATWWRKDVMWFPYAKTIDRWLIKMLQWKWRSSTQKDVMP